MKGPVKRLCYILMISTLFVACQEEASPLIDIPQELVGQWTQVSEVRVNCPNRVNNGTEEKDCTSSHCLEYTFESRGVLTRRAIKDGNSSVEINNFTLGDEELFIENGSSLDILRYELFEDQLNLIFEDSRTRCTVVQVFTMN